MDLLDKFDNLRADIEQDQQEKWDEITSLRHENAQLKEALRRERLWRNPAQVLAPVLSELAEASRKSVVTLARAAGETLKRLGASHN